MKAFLKYSKSWMAEERQPNENQASLRKGSASSDRTTELSQTMNRSGDSLGAEWPGIERPDEEVWK